LSVLGEELVEDIEEQSEGCSGAFDRVGEILGESSNARDEGEESDCAVGS